MFPFSYKKRSKVIKTISSNSVAPQFKLNGHQTRHDIVLAQQIYMVDAIFPDYYPYTEIKFEYILDLSETSFVFTSPDGNIVRFIFKSDGSQNNDFIAGYYAVEVGETLQESLENFITVFEIHNDNTYYIKFELDKLKITLRQKDAQQASVVIDSNPNDVCTILEEYYAAIEFYQWTNTGLKYQLDKQNVYKEDQRNNWLRSARTRNDEQVDFFEIPQYGRGNILSGEITEDYEFKLQNNEYVGFEAYNQELYTLLESDLTKIVQVDKINKLKNTEANKNYKEIEYYADLSNRLWSNILKEDSQTYEEVILELWDEYMLNGDEISPVKEDIEAHDVSGRHANIYNSPFYLVRDRHPNAMFDQYLIEISDNRSIKENYYELKDVTNNDIPYQDLKPEYNSSYEVNLNASDGDNLYFINEWDLQIMELNHHPYVEEKRYTDIDDEILEVLTNYRIDDEQQRDQLILAEDWIQDEVIYTTKGYSDYQSEPCQGFVFSEMLRR